MHANALSEGESLNAVKDGSLLFYVNKWSLCPNRFHFLQIHEKISSNSLHNVTREPTLSICAAKITRKSVKNPGGKEANIFPVKFLQINHKAFNKTQQRAFVFLRSDSRHRR